MLSPFGQDLSVGCGKNRGLSAAKVLQIPSDLSVFFLDMRAEGRHELSGCFFGSSVLSGQKNVTTSRAHKGGWLPACSASYDEVWRFVRHCKAQSAIDSRPSV